MLLVCGSFPNLWLIWTFCTRIMLLAAGKDEKANKQPWMQRGGKRGGFNLKMSPWGSPRVVGGQEEPLHYVSSHVRFFLCSCTCVPHSQFLSGVDVLGRPGLRTDSKPGLRKGGRSGLQSAGMSYLDEVWVHGRQMQACRRELRWKLEFCFESE